MLSALDGVRPAPAGTHRTPPGGRHGDPAPPGSYRTAPRTARRQGAWCGSHVATQLRWVRPPPRCRVGHEEASTSVSSSGGGRGEGRDVVSIAASSIRGFPKPQERSISDRPTSPLDRRRGRSLGGRPATRFRWIAGTCSPSVVASLPHSACSPSFFLHGPSVNRSGGSPGRVFRSLSTHILCAYKTYMFLLDARRPDSWLQEAKRLRRVFLSGSHFLPFRVPLTSFHAPTPFRFMLPGGCCVLPWRTM